MRTRRLVDDNNRKNIVWFGSYGKNDDGTAKFAKLNDKHANYVDNTEGVASGLTQRLSIMRGELWYAINTGIPLLDKHASKGVLDAFVVKTVLEYPDVKEILLFESQNIEHEYKVQLKVQSVFGVIELSI